MYKLSQIAQITGCSLVGPDYTVRFFLLDSRNLQGATNTLFIALKTGRNNGHNYISSLVKKGVKAFLILNNEIEITQYPDNVSFLVSNDPLTTLQRLAAYHRQRFSITVIGITGSNGKTVVKEWLYQLLKNKYTICRSPKSYNSQVGVPLSVLNMDETHTLAIFEAGISQPGEMDKITAIIQPTIGVLTSLGSAHDEGFNSREHKLGEKLKLMTACNTVIINGPLKKEIKEWNAANAIFVSENKEADLKFSFKNGNLQIVSNKILYNFALPFSDSASVSNAATCVALLLHLRVDASQITKGLSELQPVALRMEIKNGINNSFIINDFYNSDLDSFSIALGYLDRQNRKDRKVVIVSDIEQSGILPDNLYRQMAVMLSHSKTNLVIGIGRHICSYSHFFESGSLFFNDTEGFIKQFSSLARLLANAGILLKGARSFGFENISRLLQQKSHDTIFEINLNRLTDNINYYRSLTGNKVKLMCMVKAMAYGSGGAEIALTLQHIGVSYLAVAYADEGVELRQAQVELPVMVMSPEEDAFEDMINYRLEPEIYSFKLLHAFVQQLTVMGIAEVYPVHIKVDTGMHRLGFEEHELTALASQLKNMPQLKVQSVFSHLAASDNEDFDDFTREQINVFDKACTILKQQLGYHFIRHICNSGGITRHSYAHYDMVRLGIGMYGIGVNSQEQIRLQNVGFLKTRISQIKNIMAGDTVSYNRSGKINNNTRIAILPIGYADGFSRLLGNGRHGVYVKGKLCKTVGSVCMDMCMIDIGGIDCSEGDEVIIFENVQQIEALAKAMGTISYEVLTGVSGRVKRVYVQE